MDDPVLYDKLVGRFVEEDGFVIINIINILLIYYNKINKSKKY